MKYTLYLSILATAVFSIGWAIDEPRYTVIRSDGDIEIREYQSYVIVETFMTGTDMNEASNDAFKKLFKFISGYNLSKSDIPMTAPVTTTRSEKIEMTAPVTTTKSGDGYTVAFVMPEDFTLETTPLPVDSFLSIREIPSRRVAVIRFSGRWTESNMQEHEKELLEWLHKNEIRPLRTPIIARYDPPFMPWFLRRNEVQIEV